MDIDATLIKKEVTIVNTSTILLVALFALLIASAEAVLAFVGVVPGVLLDAVLLFALLNLFLFRKGSFGEIYLVLALLPLLRIFSLVVPVIQVPPIYWYAMAGTPFLLALGLAARFVKPRWAGLQLDRRAWAIQGLIAVSGLPLAVAAYFILRPTPLFARLDWQEILIGSLILILFSGFTEELVFRSMLQPVMQRAFGRYGLLISSALYASMFLGSLTPGFILLMGLVGLLFGYSVERSGSIWGAVIAHSILSIGLILILPVLWY
jgi:membrane protease YdiL (CAAX protease family)